MKHVTEAQLRELANLLERRANYWLFRFENPEVLVNARHLADFSAGIAKDIREVLE